METRHQHRLRGISTRYSPELKQKIKQKEAKGKLFDIKADPSESDDLYNGYPQVVQELTALLQKYKERESSVKDQVWIRL
ncbi:hypothetical protein GF407_10795 [candidate division KSB1 bacterium]|nr:hypothetical protein [candidate division KSB1 bacterium]